MDFPASYVYGGRKRKRNQGTDVDLRSALDAHIRDHLNLTALRTQDKSAMAWTLGELAFFCYTSAVEAQDSRGVPAAQAVHRINFFEAARFIASERGILGRTSDDVLKRVSVSMAARFVKSRLPEALESFIIEHGPPPCKPTARLLPAANARSQASNPAAVHQGVASAAAASYGTGSCPSHTNPASGSARISAGPRQTQPVQCSERIADPASLRSWQPLFRNYGTQTWESLLTPRWRLMLEPHGEVEEQELGAPCSAQSGELQAGAFRRSCGTQTWGSLVARVSRPSAGQEPKPDVQAENPPETAPQAAISPMALSAMPSQAPPAHQAPGPSTQQPTVAADTAKIGDNDTGVRDTGINNTGANNTGASDAGNGSARLWEHTCSMKCESTNSDTDLVPDDGKLGMDLPAAVKCDQRPVLQQLLCPPTQGGARRSPLRQRQGPLPPPSASPQVPPSSQQHKQHPPMALHQRPQQWHQEQWQWQHKQQWQHQPLPSQRQQQPSRNRATGRSPSYPSSGEPRCSDPPKAADELFLQPNVGGPEGRGNTHAVVEATPRSAVNHELQHGELQQQWEQQKQQGQGQGRHHQEHQEHRQGHHPWLGQQQSPLQPPLEQQAGQYCAEGAREQEAQQKMAPTLSPEKQQHCGRPGVTNQLRVARQCEEERGASASAAAALGMVAAENQVVQSSHFAGSERASGAVAAAAVAAGGATTAAATAPAVGHQCRSAGPVGAAATTAFGTSLTEPLFGQLRREYDKRLANAALEKRLRNHLCKKGNSSIRQYCMKEGMPWTLLEVVCYGVALQKMAIQPFGVDSAIEFLARVKGWRLANEGTNTVATEAAEPRRPCELSPSLVQKVAAAMAGAISKYSLMDFIERQHRNKQPPRPPPQQQQQQQELGAVAEPAVEAWRLEPAALGDAITNANVPRANAAAELPTRAAEVAAAAGAGADAWLCVPQQNAPRSHANQSPSETIGTTMVMTPAITTTTAPSSYKPQHSCSGDSGIRGIGRRNTYATTGPDAAATSGAAAAVSLLQEQLGSGVVRRTNGRRSPSTRGRQSRGSGARSKGLEVRLRVHLQKLNVRSLRRCNLSEGVGWTLLDLAEKDRDVRLQMGCEDFQDADVVRRLLDAKVGPGSQLSPAAIQTVSECVRRAHRKYRIGDFVAAEIRKHIKRKRKGSTGDAATGTPAAAPIGAGAVGSAGANGASS